MSNWYPSVYKAFIYASIVVFIVGFFADAKGSFAAYLAGYSLLTLGIMMILIVLFSKIMNANNSSTSQLIYSMLTATGPFILILGVISFVIFMLIQYKKLITEGHVAPSYNSFSNIIIILIMVQIYLVITNIGTEKFETTGKISKVVSSMMYLLGVLSAISSITLYTILKYYSTDGFTNVSE